MMCTYRSLLISLASRPNRDCHSVSTLRSGSQTTLLLQDFRDCAAKLTSRLAKNEVHFVGKDAAG